MPRTTPLTREQAEALGRKLRELREERGLAQERLAHEAGISRNHFQLLEQGRSSGSRPGPSNPHLSTLIALARALQVPVGVLIDVVVPPADPAVEYLPEA